MTKMLNALLLTFDGKSMDQCDQIGQLLKVLRDTVYNKSSQKYLVLCWAIVKDITFKVKFAGLLFGRLLEIFELLFNPTSGHTGCERLQETGNKNINKKSAKI